MSKKKTPKSAASKSDPEAANGETSKGVDRFFEATGVSPSEALRLATVEDLEDLNFSARATLAEYAQDCQAGQAHLQAIAAKRVMLLRGDIERGDGAALIDAMALVAREGLAAPTWLGERFFEACCSIRQGHHLSWDDVFGRPFPKSTHLDSVRWRLYIGPHVGQAVFEALVKDAGRAVDKGLFEEIGVRFDMGATDCEKVYRFAIQRGMIPDTQGIRRQAADWPNEKKRIAAAIASAARQRGDEHGIEFEPEPVLQRPVP